MMDSETKRIKEFIGIYIDSLINNEELLSMLIARRSYLKERLEQLEKELSDHKKNLEDYEIKL